MENRRNERSRSRVYLWAGAAMVVVVGAGALVFASVPHTFAAGETLTADNLNGNLTALDQRLAAVEALVPAGTIIAFAGPSATAADGGAPVLPPGWLLCDGSAVSRTTYATLFAASGITFGGGDGVTTFNLPDLRGRTIIGAGSGMGLTARKLGQTLGEESHVLTANELPSHAHDASGLTVSTAGSHTHAMQCKFTTSIAHAHYGNPGFVSEAPSTVDGDCGPSPVTTAAGDHTHTISGSVAAVGGGAAHNVMQPSAALNYLVKY